MYSIFKTLDGNIDCPAFPYGATCCISNIERPQSNLPRDGLTSTNKWGFDFMMLYTFLSKKAQVTLFIIIGILLLLALILVITLKTEVIKFKPEQLLPTEKGKVESFLTGCIEKLGGEALFKVGLQGGYIEVPTALAEDNTRTLKTSPLTTAPYWAYGQDTYIPSLSEIKTRVDKYIQQNLRSCMLEWEPFQGEYDIIEKSPITVNTEFVESKVIFNVHWDVEIKDKAGEVVTEVIDHVAESNIKFKKVYDTAVQVVEHEMKDLKLEDITQDLIALEHPDVPVVGMSLSCSKETWEVGKVKTALQGLLATNIPQIKIKGTDFVEFPETLPYYQNHYVWDLGEDVQQPKVNVQFLFDERNPFYFAVTPISGTKMKSSGLGGSSMLSYLCIQTWKFTYDVVYPVQVRIRDETTGYNFYTAFTVHLIKNQKNRVVPMARKSYYFDNAESSELCQRANVPVTIGTHEIVDNGAEISYTQDLWDVNLSFTCITYRCEMGSSEYDFAGLGFSGVSTNLPYCVGGILRGTKPGYLEDWKRIVTKAGDRVELNLKPVYELPVSKIKVFKHELKDNKDVEAALELGKNEIVMIKLSQPGKNSTQFATPFTSILPGEYPLQEVVVSKEINLAQSEQQKLQFLAKADFEYDLEINLIEQKSDGSDATFKGGYKTKWYVPWEQLKNSPAITFHVFTKQNPNEEESVELMLGLDEYSKKVPKPEFKPK